MNPERRKTRRFQAPGLTLAVMRPDYFRFGQIKNVSMGGLSFDYMCCDRWTDDTWSELDIFWMGQVFYLFKVPFKVVSDVEHAKRAPSAKGGVRRCNVKFGKLTKAQKDQLTYLVENYHQGMI
jgi:hypothetical protein